MIDRLFYPAPCIHAERTLLVMLPGVGSTAEEFAVHGFISAVQDSGRPIDVIAACPELDIYLEGKAAIALHNDIVTSAMAQGYAQLWFLGISLGGLGALLYAATPNARIDGLVLLAPFLGTPGTIAEIAAAGGIPAWSAEHSRATGGERAALLWLQDYIARAATRPALYLGYGQHDRFARGHQLLAAHLPTGRVIVSDGRHDWDSWATLWRQFLGRPSFAATIGAGGHAEQ